MDHFAEHDIVRRLDSGGLVELYEGRQSGPPREPRLLVRIAGEAIRWAPWADPALAKILVHPNIVRMYESAAFDEPQTFSLELVRGPSLRELLLRARPPPHVACYVIREMCTGLAAALDSRGRDGSTLRWTHGQICPRAVQISFAGDVKVSGFGLGRLKPERKIELDGDVTERLQFLAPEQATGQTGDSPDPETDVFLVGEILHAMLSDEPMFEEREPLQVLRALTTHEGETFSRVASGVSRPLEHLLSSMLAPDPKLRPASAVDVLHALEGVPESRDPAEARAHLIELCAPIR